MRSKYHAKPITIDGHRFPSLAEGRRYKELKLLEKAGRIKNLILQAPFPIVVNRVYICTYLADFDYSEDNQNVVEDVKGVKTPIYKLKKKLVEALYGITITEVK